jgi:HK97 family phage major capsid protein
MTTAPTPTVGFADNLRRSRLLQISNLMARSDGGCASLEWPNAFDHGIEENRRDLTFAGHQSQLLSLGQQIRQHSAIARAGASFLTLSTVGDSDLPSIDRSKKASWIGNSADAAPTLDLILSTPKRLSAYLTISKQLLKTSPALAASFVEAQLLSAIGAAIDDGAINSTGAGGTPVGLLADPGLQEHTLAGAATAADLLQMEKIVAENHGEHDHAALGWLTDSGTRKALRALPRMTGGVAPVWPDTPGGGPLGYQATTSPFAPAGTLIFGNFADLLILQTGKIEVLSNPYSADSTGFIRLTVSGFFDIVATNPSSSFVRAI